MHSPFADRPAPARGGVFSTVSHRRLVYELDDQAAITLSYPALRSYVTSKLDRITRHFDQVVDVKVLLTVEKQKEKEKRQRACTVHVQGNHLFVESYPFRPVCRRGRIDGRALPHGCAPQGPVCRTTRPAYAAPPFRQQLPPRLEPSLDGLCTAGTRRRCRDRPGPGRSFCCQWIHSQGFR